MVSQEINAWSDVCHEEYGHMQRGRLKRSKLLVILETSRDTVKGSDGCKHHVRRREHCDRLLLPLTASSAMWVIKANLQDLQAAKEIALRIQPDDEIWEKEARWAWEEEVERHWQGIFRVNYKTNC